MFFVCGAENDLYRTLTACGFECRRYARPEEAVAAAAAGEAVLVLADEYPAAGVSVDESLVAQAEQKRLRLYLEYPSGLPGLEIGEPRQAQWERVVVNSEFFEPALEKGSILAMHACWYLPISAGAGVCHLALARVAGYRRALFGTPAEIYPLLLELRGGSILAAASSLSRFITARYAPKYDWRRLWQTLLQRLCPEESLPTIDWTPSVRTVAGPAEKMPADAEKRAFNRSAAWFRNEAVYSIDRKKGVIEGFESGIDYNGRQMRRTWPRNDCISEAAMVFALDWAANRNPGSRLLAEQIMDYIWLGPDFVQNNPNNPAYGLLNWYERGPVFYGDDNARAILAGLSVRRLLKTERWNRPILRCLLANLRTTGKNGFRHNSLRYPESFSGGCGWRFYFDEDFVCYAPHYQAYLWAAFLWGYALTGYDLFLTRAKTAIRMTMSAWPNWRWTNGLTQELARMLLPLAFLVRVEDRPEHGEWLGAAGNELMRQMRPSGAIHELLGPLELGTYPPPQSNESYGSAEASIIQQTGDPACDLLYTANFAFIGLHEGAAALGDERMKEAEERLASFLCRIQVRSEVHAFLDGAWMRGFDDDLWEYWGSSSDAGWGAWCVETGWTNSWISSVLAMRLLGINLFDVEYASGLAACLPELKEEMLNARGSAAEDAAGEIKGHTQF